MSRSSTKLTKQQEIFVQELLKDKSQREAFRIAYPASIKWKDNVVDVKASQLFKNDKVRIRYDELHDKIIQKAENECIISATEVLKELKAIGFARITDYLEVKELEVVTGYERGKNGKPDKNKPIIEKYKTVDVYATAKIHGDKLAALAEIKQTKDGISIKMHDKVKALEDLGKHLGLFTDKIEVKGTIGVKKLEDFF